MGSGPPGSAAGALGRGGEGVCVCVRGGGGLLKGVVSWVNLTTPSLTHHRHRPN